MKNYCRNNLNAEEKQLLKVSYQIFYLLKLKSVKDLWLFKGYYGILDENFVSKNKNTEINSSSIKRKL